MTIEKISKKSKVFYEKCGNVFYNYITHEKDEDKRGRDPAVLCGEQPRSHHQPRSL